MEEKNLPVVVQKRSKNKEEKPSKNESEKEKNLNLLKILPVRNVVLFPHNVMPLTAGKEWTSESVDRVLRIGGSVGILAYKTEKAELQSPAEDLYCVGTEAKILKIIRFPDGTYGALLQGLRRFRVIQYIEEKEGEFNAEVEFIENSPLFEESLEMRALGKAMKQLVQKAISLSPNIPSEAALFIDHVQDPLYLGDLVVPYLSVEFSEKQALLETEDVEARLRKIHQFLTREIEVLEITQKINSDVKSELGKQQRKYLVREQMRLLQKELGEIEGKTSQTGSGGSQSEPQDLNERILNSKMTKEAREAVLREVERMGMMQPGAPEYMVSHNYVTWMLDLPWEVYSQEDINLKKAKEILDGDHYGLKKVKKRILEFLAVCALKKSLKGPILLFVGPPGVGKTSLGKSIAKALGRKFVRIALGGVRDEAEIRGHRRTYIGSMPGKIVDSLKKAGTMDPVILFDEIDKLASDGRGDPSSALLEVLDPEQNSTFTDHYLNTPIDLSKVFFIATANNLHSIPSPLRDRMEVIELNSYTLEEKNHIAFEHLLPEVIVDHGLKEVMDIQFDEETMKSLIELYTREAGVRQLKRELAGVVRGIARDYVEKTQNESQKATKSSKLIRKRNVKLQDIREYLGPEIFLNKKRPKVLPLGVSTGLAWTPNGGDVLYIETAKIIPGTGKTSLTGQLGDVMKESVQTAFAFIKSNAELFGVDTKEFQKCDLHIHFPEGAVKKDGPSAGIAAFCAIVSQFSGKMLSTDLAMTGEISLRGDVLPVGGVKEKLLAAHRYGIKNVLIPQENKRDLEDIPKEVLKEMNVVFVSQLAQVYKFAFAKKSPPTPKRVSTKKKKK